MYIQLTVTPTTLDQTVLRWKRRQRQMDKTNHLTSPVHAWVNYNDKSPEKLMQTIKYKNNYKQLFMEVGMAVPKSKVGWRLLMQWSIPVTLFCLQK